MANFMLVLVGFYSHLQKQKSLPQMGGSIAEPRLPQSQKCMKHRGLKYSILINIGVNTDDQEKLYRK